MAVINMPQGSKLVIKVQTGVNTSGKPVYRMRSYQTLKTTAADADVYAIGQAMGAMQTYPVIAVTRVNEGNLVSNG